MTAILLVVFPHSAVRPSSLGNLWAMIAAILLGASVYALGTLRDVAGGRPTRGSRAVDLDAVSRPTPTGQVRRSSRIVVGERSATSERVADLGQLVPQPGERVSKGIRLPRMLAGLLVILLLKISQAKRILEFRRLSLGRLATFKQHSNGGVNRTFLLQE